MFFFFVFFYFNRFTPSKTAMPQERGEGGGVRGVKAKENKKKTKSGED